MLVFCSCSANAWEWTCYWRSTSTLKFVERTRQIKCTSQMYSKLKSGDSLTRFRFFRMRVWKMNCSLENTTKISMLTYWQTPWILSKSLSNPIFLFFTTWSQKHKIKLIEESNQVLAISHLPLSIGLDSNPQLSDGETNLLSVTLAEYQFVLVLFLVSNTIKTYSVDN